MTPGDLQGAGFGPTDVPLTAERVAELVAATGDDPVRWSEYAPPAFAAVLLFAVAGDFLWDPRIADHTRTLLHLDQSFVYEGGFPVGERLTVTGTVTRARERSGSHFITFEAEAAGAAGVLLRSQSTFVMSAQPTGEPGGDDGEPPATERAVSEVPIRRSIVLGDLPLLHKSASRADLIRYAAATKDFNPIHWDHEAARAGGAPGVIVHGLLMLAWALQAVAAVGIDPAPVAAAKVRFRNPLRPAAQAVVAASVEEISARGGDARVGLAVRCGDDDLVTGSATVRLPGR